MSETIVAKGQCLCGTLQIEAKTLNPSIGACHCDTCRRWTGGPLLAVECGAEVTVMPEEHVTVFDSSEWAERAFCRQCGTHLFYRLKEGGKHYMPAGLFDGVDFVLDHQIFIDRKPAYYQFANPTKDMTGAEMFALFEAEGD